MARAGLIANLDHARLPSLNNLDARFRQPVWDPALRWGRSPYMWNATGIVYNRAQACDAARLVGPVESSHFADASRCSTTRRT